jgi:hypothetical protein
VVPAQIADCVAVIAPGPPYEGVDYALASVSLVIVTNELPILLWAPPNVVPIAQSVNCAPSGTYHLRDNPHAVC